MKPDQLPGLQIARAVAALGIAYFHSWYVTAPFPAGTAYPIPLLQNYGWIAVDFFFAISGFVICVAVTSPKFRPLEFAIHRVFRLYPLWIATSLIYLKVTDYVGRTPGQTMDFFYYSLTLLPTQGSPFYGFGWSLQHEIAFYMLAGVIAPLFGLPALIAVLAAGAIADRLFDLPWYLHQYFSYYGNFLAGIAAFLVYRSGIRSGIVVPSIGAAIVFWIADHMNYGRTIYPMALFFVLLSFIGLKSARRESPGVLLGDASYSIYLLHPLVFACIYIDLQPPLPPLWTQEFIRFGALIVVCAAAITSWMLFENPINRLARKLKLPSRNTQERVAVKAMVRDN